MTKQKGRLGGIFNRRPAATEKEQVPMAGFGNRTPEQIAAALEVAREARAGKARLLKDIKDGKVTLTEILSEDFKENERAQRLPVETLLRALPGVGSKTADSVMADLEIARTRRVGGLGVRQREMLLKRLAR